jgi:hypothetical protein
MKIDLDAQTEVLTLDGVRISFELLKSFANPDPKKLYFMQRAGDVVTVQTLTPIVVKELPAEFITNL